MLLVPEIWRKKYYGASMGFEERRAVECTLTQKRSSCSKLGPFEFGPGCKCSIEYLGSINFHKVGLLGQIGARARFARPMESPR